MEDHTKGFRLWLRNRVRTHSEMEKISGLAVMATLQSENVEIADVDHEQPDSCEG